MRAGGRGSGAPRREAAERSTAEPFGRHHPARPGRRSGRMTLTREENELLTRVGPGTPGGALMRRYWYPVAMKQELTDEQPTRFVRLLGEDLALFRDKLGRVGLLADHCAHRGASLCYGRVE